MNLVTTARRWNGWYRSRASLPWQLLAASDDYATCLRQLRDAAPWAGPAQEILVSPCHRDPNARRIPH